MSKRVTIRTATPDSAEEWRLLCFGLVEGARAAGKALRVTASHGHLPGGSEMDIEVVVSDLDDEDGEHSCSDCGWTGTGFHACQGRPGEGRDEENP